MEELDEIEVITPAKARANLLAQASEITSALSTADKIDFALPTVVGLEVHDHDMDDIAHKAVTVFNDLIALGGNVPDMHAGKIYEVAGQMLKTALEAKNAKADKKLRMIELQLKKVRSEQIDLEQGNGQRRDGANGGDFDRNELLRLLENPNDTDK